MGASKQRNEEKVHRYITNAMALIKRAKAGSYKNDVIKGLLTTRAMEQVNNALEILINEHRWNIRKNTHSVKRGVIIYRAVLSQTKKQKAQEKSDSGALEALSDNGGIDRWKDAQICPKT